MNYPGNITFRRRGAYVNIDVDGTEIGSLRLGKNNHVVDSWATHLEDKTLVSFIGRCYQAANHLLRP